MRRLASLVLAVALSATLVPSVAAEPKPDRKPARATESEKARRPATLDDLFTRLAAAKDESEANGIANLIERRWSRSGSDTADLLMSRAGDAIKANDHALAIELLDRVVTLKPEWAEGWNKRATAFFMMDDPVSSIADIRQVLTREPRHFGAWAGLGHIYMSGGDKKHALEAYRKALAIHPYLAKLKEIVERLTPEIDGRDI
jgi:tetratricopeptide (TPR) repeat protein